MAFIGLKLPSETARLFAVVDVPGKPEGRGFLHVTLVYMGSDTPLDEFLRAVEAVNGVVADTRPVLCSVDTVQSFAGGEDGYPIICPVMSDEVPERGQGLHALHARLCEALDKAGVEYSKKWPEYKPHVTLAYAEEPMDPTPIPPIEWVSGEIVMWGGDDYDDRLTVTIPFTPGSRNAMAVRVACRHLREVGNGTTG